MLVVNAEGRVVKVEVITPANAGFDEIAIKAFKELRFAPALDADGKAVASNVGPMTWRFRLEDG
jgi:TonB family protein